MPELKLLFLQMLVILLAARRLLPAGQPPGLGRFAAVMIFLLASVWTTETLVSNPSRFLFCCLYSSPTPASAPASPC